MAYVTGTIDEISGPIIDLFVGVDEPRERLLTKHGLPIPGKVRIRAQIDTGSALTAIDPQIVNALDLRPIDKISILTPSTGSEPFTCSRFVVSLSLAHMETRLYHPTFLVIESEFGSEERIRGVIGRDLMKKCLFVYDGERSCFSFAF